MKGQLFTMDVLLALLVLTIIVGAASWAFEEASLRDKGNDYQKISMLANDWSQIAVKRTLTKSPYGSISEANVVYSANMDSLNQEMSDAIGPPYAFEVKLSADSFVGNGGCAGRANVASSRRMVLVNPDLNAGILDVKICA